MLDFFNQAWVREPARSDSQFGINDGQPYAHTCSEEPASAWNALVSNPGCLPLQFIPVDKNIVVADEDGNMRSMCDGMLYTLDHEYVAFVELKDRDKSWQSKALAQLESTIALFVESHDAEATHRRFAYACNLAHPFFHYSTKETMQRFYQKYRFRILFQREINVR